MPQNSVIKSAVGKKYSKQIRNEQQAASQMTDSASKNLSSRLMKKSEVRLQFMDDFCKQAHIFTNKDDALRHSIDHSRQLHKVYETSLEAATKSFKVHPEAYLMDVLLKGKQEEEKKKPAKRPEASQLMRQPSAIVSNKGSRSRQHAALLQSQISQAERQKEEERRRLLDKYHKDQNKFLHELEGLNKTLQSESFDIADAQEMCKKSSKKKATARTKSKTVQESGKLTGISHLTNTVRPQGIWALRPLIKAVGKIGDVKYRQVDGLQRTLEKVNLDKKIMTKEKLEAIWKDESYCKTGPYDI